MSDYICPKRGEFTMCLSYHQQKCKPFRVFVPAWADRYVYAEEITPDALPEDDGSGDLYWEVWGISAQDVAEQTAKKWDARLYEMLSSGDGDESELVANMQEGASLLVRVESDEGWKTFYVDGWMSPSYSARTDPPWHWKDGKLISC